MTVHNRRHKKQILKEASILLEYNRIKGRTKPEDKHIWEAVERSYNGSLLTEETLTEQKALVNWLKMLGKGATDSVKSWVDKYLKGEDKDFAKSMGGELKKSPVSSEIKNLLKDGQWSKAYTVGMDWMNNTYNEEGATLSEEKRDCSKMPTMSIGYINCKWNNFGNWGRGIIMVFMLLVMNVGAMPGEDKKSDSNIVNKAQTEYVIDGDTGTDINKDFDKLLDDNPEKRSDIKVGDKTAPNAGYDSGAQFEFGSSQLDTAGQKQVQEIAKDYCKMIKAAQDSGDSIDGITLDVKGGASNTGNNWDVDNAREGSLSQNRAISFAKSLLDAIQSMGPGMGIDAETLSQIDVNASGMDSNELGAKENVKTGEKDDNQMAACNLNIETTPAPVDDTGDSGTDIFIKPAPDMAKFNLGDTTQKKKEPFNPGTARGSRNLEYRDLLFLGGIDPIPVTFGDYKSDAEMGRVDWRDVDTQGDKFLEDQQKMAIWITNTRKAKFPILKRIQNALQGVIDIEFDGGMKYKGVVGKKYEPSTTTRIAEQKGKLPSEINKEPEIPQKIKSLQSNTTSLWKYILGNKAIGDVITGKEAEEFDKNMKEVLQQLDLMYGKSGTRGNVNFRFRRNPNYKGSKYSDIPTTWNKKIAGDEVTPTDVVTPGQEEVLPYVQDYTGDYIQGLDGQSLIGIDAYDESDWRNLQEEIKRIKKLMT